MPEGADFPAGQHAPILVSPWCAENRWFFATPQAVFEVSLLTYLQGLLSRGGLSFTAFAIVYQGMWAGSMTGTMYAHRTHLVQRLEVAIIAAGAMQMFMESGLDARDFVWTLRPRHEASDFEPLLSRVRQAFKALSASHACWLTRRVRALIVDGQWCVQTSICNARDCNPVFSADVKEGYFKGCTHRPVRGGLYCTMHNHPAGDRWQEPHPSEGIIEDHRKIVRDSGIALEYKVDGAWLPAMDVATADARIYEKRLLRRQQRARPAEECSKDERKDVDELLVGRKTAGVLVAVTPCLQIAAIAPMWSSESISQLLLFLMSVMEFCTDLAYVIYDNACAVARHLRKRQRESPPADPAAPAWAWLLQLRWVIDRLHFTYHKSCRDRTSALYVPGVDADEHPCLKGVDTEAAEQLFSVAKRWQIVLTKTHPVHEELLLLIFARDHNKRHACRDAADKYRAAQEDVGPRRRVSRPTARVDVVADACDAVEHMRRRKRPKAVLTACGAEPMGQVAPAAAAAGPVDEQVALPMPDSMPRVAKAGVTSTYIWVNQRTKTVHHTVLKNYVSAGCGYYFGQAVMPQLLEQADVVGCFTCGTCYGWRARICANADAMSGA